MEKSIQTVTITFFRFEGIFHKIWAFAQMGFARRKLRKIDPMIFFKLFGSGTGEGFTPYPNTSVYAILGVWKNSDVAERIIGSESIFARYKKISVENWTVFLTPISSKGEWDRCNPFEPITGNPSNVKKNVLAALTRATIKPSILLNFWSKVPAISKMIGQNENVLFKIGLGEVPWFHQVTFSIWPDAESMAEFARKDGPHARAIKSVREGKWFSEELYARFRVQKATGTWGGKSVL